MQDCRVWKWPRIKSLMTPIEMKRCMECIWSRNHLKTWFDMLRLNDWIQLNLILRIRYVSTLNLIARSLWNLSTVAIGLRSIIPISSILSGAVSRQCTQIQLREVRQLDLLWTGESIHQYEKLTGRRRLTCRFLPPTSPNWERHCACDCDSPDHPA